MSKLFFNIIRPGINTTIQDLGRNNYHHIGLPSSGAMDKRNFVIANKLVGNNLVEACIEFAYQGPLLELVGGNIVCAVTGNISFKILRKNLSKEQGICYKSFSLQEGDKIDILSTNKSVYGYLSIKDGLIEEKDFGSYSTNTKAKIGANNGEKFNQSQKILINKNNENYEIKSLKYINSKIEFIRIIKGTNFNYFSKLSQNKFVSDEYKVSKLTDRMGMRLEGGKIENITNTNIKSEGLVKGVIQVPADGKPIIMLSDHGTIGGYPKIAVVISADYDRLTQLIPGSKIKFKYISLKEAQNLLRLYDIETENILNQIR